VMAPGSRAAVNKDSKDYLFTFPLKNGSASWYSLAVLDLEGTNDPIPVGGADATRYYVARLADIDHVTSQEQLLTYVKQVASRLKVPVTVKMLSSAAGVQSAPSDSLRPIGLRTYKQAIDLLQKEIDRTAANWELVIAAAPPGGVSNSAGDGFFTDGDNQTGEWKPQKGFFWTGSFWTAELWKMYSLPHDEKYRRWAELWTSALVGKEFEQNHDT